MLMNSIGIDITSAALPIHISADFCRNKPTHTMATKQVAKATAAAGGVMKITTVSRIALICADTDEASNRIN